MVRGNMLRLAVALSGVAMLVNGCKCDEVKPPVTCADAVVVFEQPTAGATVDSTFDVSIVARTADGAAFNFDSASLKIGSGTFTGEVSGNRATFIGVTAAAGAQELSAAIAQGSCSQTGKQTVTVRGTSCTTPAVTAVTFPQDTQPNGPNGTLNSIELPVGQAIQVRVAATCVSGVQVRIKRGMSVVSGLTSFMNSEAVVTLNDTNPANDTYAFTAELVRDGQVVGSAGASAVGTIRVDRAVPTIAITTTSGPFGPKHDVSMSPGFQLDIVGTAMTGATCELTVNGETRSGLMPSEATGEFSAQFTLPAVTGMQTVTLRCVDASGNVAEVTRTIELDFKAPTVTADAGTGVITTVPHPVSVSADAEDGSTVVASIAGISVATGTITGDRSTLQIPFSSDGTFTIEISVTDESGNKGTTTITVTVALDVCGITFTRPLGAAVLLTSTQLQDGGYSFQTTSRAVCAGSVATLFRGDLLADGGVTGAQQVGTATLSSTGVADFPALTMANGDFQFRAQVSSDAGISSASVKVIVDLDGPSITNPVVPTGQPAALITAAQDTSSSSAGVQRTLAFVARSPGGAPVDVCVTHPTDENGAMLGTSPECGTGYFLLRQGVTSPVSGFSFPEGTYDIKIVITGTTVSSPPVRVSVDGTRPCVQGTSRLLPQDTNGDGRLNIAELAGAQPKLEFALGCNDTQASLAAVNGVVVRDITSGVAGAVRASTTTFTPGAVTVTLTDTYATEVDLNLFVELTDLIGNKNLLASMGSPSTFAFRVDPVAPVCVVNSPMQDTLNIAQVPGGNLSVDIVTSPDVGDAGVSIAFSGQAARPVTPVLNTATTAYTLTGDATYTIGATCTDVALNATTALARTTRIDLVAPTCSVAAPLAGAVFTDNDVVTTINVTGVDAGTPVMVNSTVTGISNNLLQVAVGGASATGTVRYPNGTQNISASLADDTGNTCTTAPVSIVMNSTACSLDFVTPGSINTNAHGSWLNRAGAGLVAEPADGTPTPGSGTATVAVVTSDCGPGKNVYLYAGGASTTPGGAPVVTTAGGLATFASQAFPEGSQYTVSIDNGSGRLSHRSFTVSLKAPSVGGISLLRSAQVMTAVPVARNAALIFGAAGGNLRVETATATDMVFGDLSAANNNAQIGLGLTNIDGAAVGTVQGTLEVLEDTTPLLPTVTVGGAPFTPTLPQLTIGHRLDDSATTLVIRVTSPAGNTYTSTHSAQVDVVAPAAPTVTRNLTSARTATVELNWGVVYDDGTNAASGGLTGGSLAAGYEIRWTTSSVPSNNAMAAVTDYVNSKAESVEPWSASAITKSISVPPLNTYFIAVRARDEVGNYSAFAAPTALSNFWGASQSVGNVSLTAAAGLGFGQNLAAGKLNNDAIDDLVVAAPTRATNVGSVFVFFGGAGFASQSTCALPNCQEIQPPDSAAGLFGTDVSVGNVGDSATEGRDDLLVAQPTWSSTSTGRAFLYFGTVGASISTTDIVEFRGVAGTNFASTARIIPSIDSDSLGEIVFSAHGFGGGQGRLYIFKGRTVSDWLALKTAGGGFVAPSAADWIIDGPSTIATNGNQFGRQRWGLQGLGDLNGDGRPEFAVPISKETDGAPTPSQLQKLFIFSGMAVANATAAIPSSSALNVLTPQLPIGTSASFDGFARAVVGNLDIVGDTSKDLLVAYPQNARIHLYTSPLLVAPAGASFETISGSQLFGFTIAAADVNGDSKVDILAGEVPATFGRAWLLSQRSGTTAFDTGIGTLPTFWSSELRVNTASTRFGRIVLLTDLTGDGNPEVIVTDDALNNVQVWR